MKVIIAGSRTIHSLSEVSLAILESGFEISEGVSGGAKGVDTDGSTWCRIMGIPVREFIPDYPRYSRYAPFQRNIDMAEYADALIAIWDGKSKGTLHMINQMRLRRKPVYVKEIK